MNEKAYYVGFLGTKENIFTALDKKFDDLEEAVEVCKTRCITDVTTCCVARVMFEAHADVQCVDVHLF
jgi:hypothetical protein